MLFSSITFLYYFLPLTLFVYYLVPTKAKNGILFLASFIFYLWGEPKYSILLLASVGIGYLGGRCIAYADKRGRNCKKVVTGCFIAVTLSILVFFKYTDFLIGSVNKATGITLPLSGIVLPIGISFYSFQIISYYVDVYRGEVETEKNILHFATYVTMFPQLIAGPIVRFQTVQQELKARIITSKKIAHGAGRFVCGLCKKVLLADSLGTLVTTLQTYSFAGSTVQTAATSGSLQGLGTAGYWVLALAYMLQIYYDFSGYSDMAIGLGSMLGFTFPENFRYPFLSGSVSEFWRRWHITLGSWFRDYLYIPLGGSRVTTMRWCRNMFIVWSLSGLWHGAGWNFMLWGTYFGMLLIAEQGIGRLYGQIKTKKLHLNIERSSIRQQPEQSERITCCTAWKAVTKHLYTLLAVLLSFVIFRTDSMSAFTAELQGLLGHSGTTMLPAVSYELRNYAILLVIACIGSTPAVAALAHRFDTTGIGQRIAWLLKSIFLLSGLLLSTAFLLGESAHPFLYFRF